MDGLVCQSDWLYAGTYRKPMALNGRYGQAWQAQVQQPQHDSA
jgi:hypothetical protein